MKMLFLVILASALSMPSCDKGPSYKEPPFDGTRYVIEMRDLKENRPEFYSVAVQKKRVSFFVVRVNGEVQSYFNACMKCYPHKKGYRDDGGFIRCGYCNEKYPMDALKEGLGTCYPLRLKGTRRDDRYIIDRSEVEAGVKFF